MNPLPLFQKLAVAVVLIASGGAAWADGEPRAHPSERIPSLETEYGIRRDGTVVFEQRFRLGVAGVAVRRGPRLNYLTVFQGPGSLLLDNELEILEVRRDGEPEPFHVERSEGYLSLFVGETDRLLEHREHVYLVRGRMEADWRKGEGDFSTVFDVAGPLPLLPIDEASVVIRLPEGVVATRFTPSLSGIEPSVGREGPAWNMKKDGHVVTVRTTATMGPNRGFFVNLAWPSETFAMKSHWLKVMRQHPRLPLAGFSATLLAWALLLLLRRASRRRG